jgi:hypothetical protein
LTSRQTFAPGIYNLSFSVGNNGTYATTNTMTVSLGSFSETFSETGAVPLQPVSRQITLTAPSRLVFATNSGDTDYTGVIIDNVSLVTSVVPVPEPGSLASTAAGTLSLLAAYAVRRWGTPSTT